jgi:hypothetical protein
MNDVGRGPWAVGRTAVLLAAVAVACARSPLPGRLCGMARGRVWNGRQAASLVAEMHGKGVAPATSAVAEYGRAGQLRVYLSRFPDAAKARRSLDVMLARLTTGSSPFSPPRELREYPGHWFTVGPGGHHAVWVSGESLYWVTADPSQIVQALTELPAASSGTWI